MVHHDHRRPDRSHHHDGPDPVLRAGDHAWRNPWDIVAGQDGNLWFTEPHADAVGRITPRGRVTEYTRGISPGAGPTGISVGADGNLWFTEPALDRVGRITPKGRVTEFSQGISLGAEPHGINAGPRGQQWFGELAANRVARISTGASAPANRLTHVSATGGRSALTVSAHVPGPGWLSALGRDGRPWCSTATMTRDAHRYRLRCDGPGRTPARVRVRVTFTPSGGTPKALTVTAHRRGLG